MNRSPLQFIPACVFLVLFAAVAGSCSTESADQPGLCKLSCSKAVIAPSDYTIKSLSSDVSVRCLDKVKEDNELVTRSVAFNVRFGVFKKQKVGDAPEREVPVPNISLYPSVLGVVPDIGTPPFYGITTPTSEFCTDSCGAATFQVVGMCPEQEDTELSLSVSSGALGSEAFTATLKAPDAEAGGTGSDTTNNTDSTGVADDSGSAVR